MPESTDVLVIGAGVIGLAVAREFALQGREVVVLEQHTAIGTEISSRNSEVIHAGIYYPCNSLKANLCVRGKSMLYTYLRERNLPFDQCGKIIVATSDRQIATLKTYRDRAIQNGAGAMDWLTCEEIALREPNVSCVSGLHSPSTGILDTHAYMTSLYGDIENTGGVVAFNTHVTELCFDANRVGAVIDDYTLFANLQINCSGLGAPNLFKTVCPDSEFTPRYARGHYYVYAGESPFSQLIYPVAEADGLGVHVTHDLAGQARFGPDVQWVDSVDYAFEHNDLSAFVEAIRRYYPALDESRLNEGYTGIRPKIFVSGKPVTDFVIEGQDHHGISGLINLFGIESPGITASLAIAEHVVKMANHTLE